MSFKWNKEWAEQILNFSKNVPEDADDLIELIELPDGVNDKRVIQTMARCTRYEMYGIEQTLLNEISRFDYKLYFESIFEIIDEFFDEETYHEDAIFLLRQGTHEAFTNLEISNITKIAKEKLDKNQMKILAKAIEYHNLEEYKDAVKRGSEFYIRIDQIYNDLYNFFMKEIENI